MRIYLILVFLVTSVSITQAQQSAITDTGEEVILYDDGTWKYVNESDEEEEIPTNETPFEKSEDATFLLKSKVFNIGFWLNPKKWKFEKGGEEDAAEYELTLKGKDLYALIITEQIEVPLETLVKVAVENAKEVAPDIRASQKEYRTVNGNTILKMQMQGTTNGIKFAYYGYYFSSPEGTLQFITYTAQNILDVYKDEIESLLNGFVVIESEPEN